MKSIESWVRTPPTNGASVLAMLGALAVIVVQLISNDGVADLTTLGLLGLAILFAFALLAPRQTSRFVARITSFKLGGIEVVLGTVANAQRVKPPGEEGDGFVVDREERGYDEIVAEMKKKARFVWHIVDLQQEVDSKYNYAEIAWKLRGRHLLNDSEARFVLDLALGRKLESADLPADVQDEFLDAAWSFAKRFGAMVWDRYVRAELEKQGMVVADFHQDPGHRPDFLVNWDGHWLALAARVGEDDKPYYYGATRTRLLGLEVPVHLAGRCVIIPAGDRTATVVDKKGKHRDGRVKVLKFQGTFREHPQLGFESDPFNQDARLPAPSRPAAS